MNGYMKNRRKAILWLFLLCLSVMTICMHLDSSQSVEASTRVMSPSISNNGYAGVFYKITMSADKNSTIYYTIDGSIPTKKSLVYNKAIILEAGNKYTIKSIAYKGSEKSSITSKTYNQKLTKLGHKVKQIIKDNIENDMSDINKVLAIVYYFEKNIKYDTAVLSGRASSSDVFNEIGALVNNLAVCDGYSKGFLLLMNRLGIPCKRVTGYVSWGDTAGNHAWNMVKLEGNWYHLEPQGGSLLMSDKEFRKRGYSWKTSSYPKCASDYYDKTFTYDKHNMLSNIDIYIRSDLKHIKFCKDIKEIPEDFFSYCNIESVEIPSSVSIIGKRAFAHNLKLEKVTIKGGVNKIDEEAFTQCTKLENITIPKGAKEIGALAFYNCSKLKEINIPNTVSIIGANAFMQTPWFDNQRDSYVIVGDGILIKENLNDYTNIIVPSNVKVISGVFSDNDYVTSIIIPDTVTKILNGAFSNTRLESVIIPDSVTEIGDGVFQYGCLNDVRFSSNLKKIGDYAFSYLSLREVILPEGLKEIGSSAFDNNYILDNVVFPKSLEKLSGSFNNTPWLDNCPDDFVIINKSILLKYKGSDSEVKIPETIKTIASSAFYCNNTITKIILPDINEIPDLAFCCCNKLEEINIPKSVTKIGENAFYETNLKSITIPGNVKAIHYFAFGKCDNLKRVILENGVEVIGDRVFEYTNLSELTIPESVRKIDGDIFSTEVDIRDIIVFCKKNTYAYNYAKLMGVTIRTK